MFENHKIKCKNITDNLIRLEKNGQVLTVSIYDDEIQIIAKNVMKVDLRDPIKSEDEYNSVWIKLAKPLMEKV